MASAFSQLRTAVGDSNLLIFIGKFTIKGDDSDNTNTINAMIEQVPNIISNTYLISSSGLTTRSDIDASNANGKFHFNTTSMRTFGVRYATKMLEILNNSGARLTETNNAIETGHNPESEYPFIIYPNPSSSHIAVNFSLKNVGSINFTVTDVSGKMVGLEQSNSSEGALHQQMDFSSLNKDIYLLRG